MAVKEKIAKAVQNFSTALFVKRLGKGLYMFGGDLICVYPVCGVEITDKFVTFEFKPYYIKVMWENKDGKRINPHWERIYKEG